jgi:hypothetical protein
LSRQRTAQLTQGISAAFVGVGIAAYGVLTAWISPVTARVNYDPSLQYMLSSLSWFRGATYDYIDHPGTPVEVLGTALFGVSYPLVAPSPEGFISYHLAHPQQFLSVAQTFIVVGSVIVGLLLARHSVEISHWSQALLASGLAALFFAVLPISFQSLALWSHESFVFPAGTLLSLGLLLAARRAGRPSTRVVLGLGFAAGVLTSVQLYFAAWVVGTAVALAAATRLSGASWRQSGLRCAVVVAVAVLGFLVATLPILSRYHQLAGWIWLLISRQGGYGSGPAGVPSPDLLASNLKLLILDAPALFVACGVSVLILAAGMWFGRRRLNSRPAVVAAGLGFVAQLLVLLVLVAKHPGVRYLLPIAAILPLLFATALDGLDLQRASVRLLVGAFGLSLLGAFGGTLVSSVASHQALASRLQRDDAATEQVLTRLADQRSVPRTSLRSLWTYGTTSPCYALWFGDDSADRAFATDIAQLCPHDANLNIWNAKVTSSSGDIKFAEYDDWDVVVLSEDEARARPYLGLSGEVFASSIPSLGQSQLLFVTKDLRASVARAAP